MPLLAVESIALRDAIGGLNDRLDVLEHVGVPLVWIIDAALETVTVDERGVPRMVATGTDLACEPHLPSFRFPVARLWVWQTFRELDGKGELGLPVGVPCPAL
ncbi:MAG: hypothetical protein K2W96_21140, partial [Gemmataceae bacterium]|nr:hypothetical protein [Gemmataceae bacterium]